MADHTQEGTDINARGTKPTHSRAVDLSDNARTVLTKRYLRRGADGKPAESIEEMFWRVAWYVAEPEDELGGDRQAVAEKYYDLLTSKRFFPNSPTFTGAGTPLGQLAACFVLKISDDMGRAEDGIFQTLRNAALIQQTGGGNGFAFSSLRPKGARVATSEGEATGPVGFLRVYDQAFGEIAQGGCLTPDTLVFTKQGLLRLDEIVKHTTAGWQDHDLTVATDEGDRHSGQAYNNGVVPVLRIQTDMGLQLTGTPNHKVKVMTANGAVWKRFDEIQSGDAILIKLGQHQGRLHALHRPTKGHGNQIMPNLPSILDEEFAFFLGYLAGDGFVASHEGDSRIGVTVAHSSYLFDEMPALMQRIFGDHLTIHRLQKEQDASITYVIDNRAVKDFFIMNGLVKAKSTEVRVPRLIRQSTPEVVGAYIRGLFEADGSISHHYPQLISSSEMLLREVATLLIGLGCPVRLYRQTSSADRYGQAPMWSLRIHSYKGLERWKARVGCDTQSRFAVCLTFKPDLSRETTYTLPHAEYWVEQVLEATRLPQIDKQHRGQAKNFRTTSPKLRRQLLRYTRGERQLTLSGYQHLSDQYPEFADHARAVDDLWFVTVEFVEDAGESVTLDIEVDDNHTYLANGLVTHNSRRGANMGVLRVNHPDIFDFITCKTNESHITNFNISVGVTDDFMQAVKDNKSFDLINPQDGSVWKTIPARELFDLMVKQAHHNGEPGILFLDAANRDNPVPHLYQLESTNPCFIGETRLATEFGLLRLDDLAEMASPLFVAADNRTPLDYESAPLEAQGVALRPASPAWKTRSAAQVLKLSTKQGYQVTATPDHRFVTPRGYVELKDLQVGDQILLQSGEGAWSKVYDLPNIETVRELMSEMAISGDRASGRGVQRRDFQELYANIPEKWSHDLGLVMGWLVGDGWLSERSGSPLGMVFSDAAMLEQVHSAMEGWFGAGHVHYRDNGLAQLSYGRLPYEFFRTLGVLPVRAHEKRVPDAIWSAPREAVIGFLQGLFSADGSAQANDKKQDCTVRLASSSSELLHNVQLLLSNFGIVCRIHQRREAGRRPMPNGKGGYADYDYKAQFELIIGKANRDRFADLIGFADETKQARLTNFIASKTRRTNREAFTDVIQSIEDAGVADVYDLTQFQTHSLIANGFVASNCGEQYLGPFENCCLGSINLAQHLGVNGTVDWEKLRRSTEESTRFLDNVVDANKYVPAVPQLELAAKRVRRIGLGIMGLADLMYHVGVRYGSKEGQEFASQVMEFVHYHAMRTSIELSRDRGPFLAIRGSLYDPDDLKWEIPQPLVPHQTNWGRPACDWNDIREGILKHGIRNGAQTTIAPTGTISTVAGCEGYGCEPVFALAYMRHFNDNGKDTILQYTSPAFEQALVNAGMDEETRKRIVEHVNLTGSCQDAPDLPERARHTFVVASDITADEHVWMQAAMQRFCSNAISKTCNFPSTATEQDVAKAYMLAWELGCKGLTVYVSGSRDKVVLETAETAKAKGKDAPAAAGTGSNGHAHTKPEVVPALDSTKSAKSGETEPMPLFKNEVKKPRARMLKGYTYRAETPLGTTFITVNENGGDKPFEVFIHTSKAGSETAAISEAMGRLISYILRVNSPVDPHVRMKEIVRQLEGIGGGRSLGLGPKRVRSLPDGVAQVLAEYLAQVDESLRPRVVDELPSDDLAVEPAPGQMMLPTLKGDLCPECGQAAVINEEGCSKCYACGYSAC